MSRPPRVNSDGMKSLEKTAVQLDTFNEQVASFNPFDNQKKPTEQEEQTKLSKREMKAMDAPVMKPLKSITDRAKFNEAYRKQWEYAWEYIKVIVENYEIPGEKISHWTHRFAGHPAHYWEVPVNKPVYVPRLLADQLSKCRYNKIVMQDRPVPVGGDEMGNTYLSGLAVQETKNRIDVRPVGESFSLAI